MGWALIGAGGMRKKTGFGQTPPEQKKNSSGPYFSFNKYVN
jgi:hypothetical protein